MPFGAGINGALTVGERLGVSQIGSTWIAASYPYVGIPTRQTIHLNSLPQSNSGCIRPHRGTLRHDLWPQESDHRGIPVVDRVFNCIWIQ